MTLEKAIEFGKIFLKTIEDEKGSATYEFVETAVKMMEQEPIVHAKWVKYCEPRCEEQHYQCTNCKDYVNFGIWGDYYQKDFRYCPHCGARMEGSE